MEAANATRTWHAGILSYIALPSEELCPLPVQPPEVPWPTEAWPAGELRLSPTAARLVDEAFRDDGPLGTTFALLVVRHGRVVLSRYGGALPHFDRPPEPVSPDTRLRSWSMAKSMLHAAIGLALSDGRLHTSDPVMTPQWPSPGDPRRKIAVEHLLDIRDGLDFEEVYDDGADAVEMLFGRGRGDVATFAADRPLAAPVGARFNYSSVASNVLSGYLARLLGPGAPYRAFLSQRIFGPLGMRSATPGFDETGTWMASSEVRATAEDYARFGLWYLRDGIWEGRRLLPEGWVDHGRTPRSIDPTDGLVHGAHWWPVGDELGSFRAAGYEGQAIVISPAADQILVRMGRTLDPELESFVEWRRAVVEALADC